ncbi:MAG: hypothetical protein P8N76_20190 [Pirellulaceae bacterium]|nr:hypothetical protein [Pirellulaceae bacterium]
MALARVAVAAKNQVKVTSQKIHVVRVQVHHPTIQVLEPKKGRAMCSPFFIDSQLSFDSAHLWSQTMFLRNKLIASIIFGLMTTSAYGQPPTAILVAPVPQSSAIPAQKLIPANSSPTQTAPDKPNETTMPTSTSGESDKPNADNNTSQVKLEQERIKKLTKLQFDRRPSTILKTWTKPVEEKQPKATEPPKKTEPPTPEEQAKQQAQAAKAAQQAAAASKEFDQQLVTFQRSVTLGDWNAVKEFLRQLSEAEQKAGYRHLLQSLSRGVSTRRPSSSSTTSTGSTSQSRSAAAKFREKNVFSFNDIIGLIEAGPMPIEKPHLVFLGTILRQTLTSGYDLDAMLTRLRAEMDRPENEQILSRRQTALLLFAAGQDLKTGEFLPTAQQAQAENDRDALNLLSRHALSRYAKEKKVEFLEQAWDATQAALAVGTVDETTKQEALKRAVELAPKIRQELGLAWLEESFQNRKERGDEILAAIGTATSTNMQSQIMNAAVRLKALQLQKTAVDALLAANPETTASYEMQLTVLAENWLREAIFTQQQGTTSSSGPELRRDSFGNIYYADKNQTYYRSTRSTRGQPIATSDIIDVRPDQPWLKYINQSVRPKFDVLFAQLYLKVNQEEQAFPYIEKFAENQPAKALELAHEFLRVWTNNHNPNQARQKTSSYMFMYGFQRRANQIPLTRSKQQRNLEELSEWVHRLRKLPIGDLDENLMVAAFTTCHSTAEVYRLEAFEDVFGSVDGLRADTLAQMAQQMRKNLAGIWRDPAEQKKKKTNRKQKDLESEVQRGYQVANQVLDQGLKKYPDSWRIRLAKACLLHDQNDYAQEIKKSSDYSARREAAMLEFRQAAEIYANQVAELSEEKETTHCFELWFYASLGAVDLGGIRETNHPDLSQIAIIREALQALPDPTSERHVGQFANSLFTRLSAVKPELKYRYLRNGFEITGNHPRAREARKVFDYYNDLVTEIKLNTRIDGTDVVGYDQPFGLFVEIEHTKEIERESGGFAKYLQNQNNQYYAFNYGRPTENYRDKFEEAATAALQEHFEVISITFNHPDSSSQSLSDYGWRRTPYAYLLLKPRGPEVDKIPPLRLDLDFLDTSGYAVIPVQSAIIPIDAKDQGEPRPSEKMQLVQTLDERQADEGKLILEIKATAHGLVPQLETLIALEQNDFEVVEIDDQGLSVTQFEKDSSDPRIVSERLWTVKMSAKSPDHTANSFTFPVANITGTEVSYQRYDDADLIESQGTVELAGQYSQPNRSWIWAAPLIGLGLVGVALLLVRSSRPRQPQQQTGRFQMPNEVTPFSVLGLLRHIESNNELRPEQRSELQSSIQRLEKHYFDAPSAAEPNLEQIAREWIQQAK